VAADELPILEVRSAEALNAWLDEHGGSSTGVWLRIARVEGPATTVTYPQAVEVALCHGWIDGTRRSGPDPGYYLQRFTPRRPRSPWSRINRDKATALIAAGRMRPTGLREVERAQADGRWDAAYAGQAEAEVPADLAAALDAEPAARAAFDALDSRNRYAVLYRVNEARRPDTRARRVEKYVAMLARGETIYPRGSARPVDPG
jgi:uncharacterized protein YdeI (YjbR/CyaY-like superfamily)